MRHHSAGFTLLELLVALVLAGVVALLVYGAAQTAFDVEARLAANRRVWQAQLGMRTLLEDALRNALPAPRPGDPVFTLEQGTASNGAPADRLTFVTRGGFPPLTSDADWRVTISLTPNGLSAIATPLGVRADTRVAGVLPGVTGLEINVQAPDGGAWTRRWPLPTAFPRAVALRFFGDSGAPAQLPPLRMTLPLGGSP
jgi:prepilin-type N-terminal cleavage/methylation domain-containing protein